jgi:L-threonylcarbamoyladenylate synthase
MKRITVSATDPDVAAMAAAAAVIRSGGIVALPTDTLYGLAVDPFNATAVARLFEAKRRPADRGIPLIASNTDQVVRAFGELSPLARQLADRFWPGPLTLVMPAGPAAADVAASSTGTVGVRVPAHAVARAVCAASDRPVTATSANVSGAQAASSPDDVGSVLQGQIDMILDAGPTPGGPPSTIVDVTGEQPRLMRAGAIPWDLVEQCLRRA